VLDLLRAIADDGRGVLMVTHQAEATARADRVLYLTDGRLVPFDESGPATVDHAEGGPAAPAAPRPRRATR
jgi:putative ABC transport system ATP-binding protein